MDSASSLSRIAPLSRCTCWQHSNFRQDRGFDMMNLKHDVIALKNNLTYKESTIPSLALKLVGPTIIRYLLTSTGSSGSRHRDPGFYSTSLFFTLYLLYLCPAVIRATASVQGICQYPQCWQMLKAPAASATSLALSGEVLRYELSSCLVPLSLLEASSRPLLVSRYSIDDGI